MERKKVIVNDTEFEFVNQYWENSRAWGHESWLLRNGIEIGHNRVTYLNRTWENYKFQTCMLGIIYELLENRKEELKEQFKEEKGISRLTKKYQNEFDKMVNDDDEMNLYLKLRDEIRGNVW